MYIGLIHLKILRIYIDSILRFGIPPKFFTGLIFAEKGKEKLIMSSLTKQFIDPSMADMYGAKEDAGDTEDYYPFSLVPLSIPDKLSK
jgi:V-type H+-transporting ATPase subunit C